MYCAEDELAAGRSTSATMVVKVPFSGDEFLAVRLEWFSASITRDSGRFLTAISLEQRKTVRFVCLANRPQNYCGTRTVCSPADF